ncbi:ABC transporter ATP-binding protein [Actinoallomurus rhizosphaericola]|uniref:ABC transporter ATP-binding protein n=1 Tax=Actinoallomurus rhizosphaericola TaxID=2952536 RepID=UPI002090D055|nr:ABC transporter ATP-binding protein [Actinoallomurus rhizosphaericola]MCO5991913.1 ABC transporter ATP-binding protein/permease [Actinoallomurus rhizosphaericola]
MSGLDGSSGSLRVLWRYVHDMRWFLAVMMVLELVGNAAALSQPLIARWVLDEVKAGGSLSHPLMVLGGLAVIGMTLSGTCTLFLGRGALRLVTNLRCALVRRVLGGSVATVERRPVGDVLSRIGTDTTLLGDTVGDALVRSAATPVVVLAALVLMGTIDVLMLGVVVGVLVITALGEMVAGQRIREATECTQGRVAAMTSSMQRALIAFRTVKASGTEQAESDHACAEAEAAFRAGRRAVRVEAFLGMLAAVSVDVTFLVVLAVGGARVVSGGIGVGDLVAFLLYVMFLGEPIDSLAFTIPQIAQGLAAVRRIEALRSLPAEAEELPSRGRGTERATRTASNGGPAPEVRFDGVWFGYDDRPVLRDVSFAARRGLTVLVGPSGAGKTTLLGLILRFADVDRGRVLLDAVDVRELERDKLRRRLAYVQQEAALLGETVREAMLYGVPSPGSADVRGALRAVALDDWASSLPRGLDTPVGERGVAISGGQRQRLAVARALLRGADVLLLDEATSQLDAVSERTLLDSLAREADSRVVLAATHRVSVAAKADQIVLLIEGGVRAVGPHAALLRSDPVYRELASAPYWASEAETDP